MRKQTKIAAVVSAAALLALGASITSFAAAKGTWMMVDGEWYCYDKNGDVYENVFCTSNGKEYYVGDDGALVRSSWVEYDGEYYFVNSSGAKITNDWRLTAPYEDEEADEEWFYFQSTGKRANNKKITYKGKTYFFDADGIMLTGWVTDGKNDVANEEGEISTSDDNTTYYCGEDGARLESAWVLTTEPSTDDDDADADEYYYYLKSSGKVATGKQNNVKGQTFIFGNDTDNKGQMLSGWVAKDKAGKYKEIGDEDSNVKLNDANLSEVYYCWHDEDAGADGHVQKNRWINTWTPEDYDDEDEDNDKFWYWIDKDGKAYIPKGNDLIAEGYKYALGDGELEKKNDGNSYVFGKKKVNSKNYFIDEEGRMLSKFIDVVSVKKGNTDIELGMHYFGGDNDGVMKTGSQSIKDDNGDIFKFYFGTKDSTTEKKGVGITGAKNNKLYFEGHLVAADDYKYQPVTIKIGNTAYTFIVNQNGTIQHSNMEYKEDGDVLIDTRDYKGAEGETVEIKFEGTGLAKYGLTQEMVSKIEANDGIKVVSVDPADVMVSATADNKKPQSLSNASEYNTATSSLASSSDADTE